MAFASGGTTANGSTKHKAEPFTQWELSVLEPSGICFHAKRNTLFVVGDEGDIAELDLNGALLKKRNQGEMDFEGVTTVPETGYLYLALEGKDRILEFVPQDLTPRRNFKVPRKYQGKKVLRSGGEGLEGITFVPDASHPEGGTFFIVNQSFLLPGTKEMSLIAEVELPIKSRPVTDKKKRKGKILRIRESAVSDLSGIYYDPGVDLLYILSDSNRQLLIYNRVLVLQKTIPLDIPDQEGLTRDNRGFMYVVQDSGQLNRGRWPDQSPPQRR